MSDTPLEIIRQVFEISPDGRLIRRKTRRRASLGPINCALHSKGYQRITVGPRKEYVHRILWALHYGYWPEHQIDHINGDRSDNRLTNLRAATPTENQCNRGTPRSNTSGFKGVTWDKKKRKWMAKISAHRRVHFLGYFDTAEAAHVAYLHGSAQLHGEFSRPVDDRQARAA